MRRKFLTLFALVLAIITVLTVVACSNNQSGGGSDGGQTPPSGSGPVGEQSLTTEQISTITQKAQDALASIPTILQQDLHIDVSYFEKQENGEYSNSGSGYEVFQNQNATYYKRSESILYSSKKAQIFAQEFHKDATETAVYVASKASVLFKQGDKYFAKTGDDKYAEITQTDFDDTRKLFDFSAFADSSFAGLFNPQTYGELDASWQYPDNLSQFYYKLDVAKGDTALVCGDVTFSKIQISLDCYGKRISMYLYTNKMQYMVTIYTLSSHSAFADLYNLDLVKIANKETLPSSHDFSKLTSALPTAEVSENINLPLNLLVSKLNELGSHTQTLSAYEYGHRNNQNGMFSTNYELKVNKELVSNIWNTEKKLTINNDKEYYLDKDAFYIFEVGGKNIKLNWNGFMNKKFNMLLDNYVVYNLLYNADLTYDEDNSRYVIEGNLFTQNNRTEQAVSVKYGEDKIIITCSFKNTDTNTNDKYTYTIKDIGQTQEIDIPAQTSELTIEDLINEAIATESYEIRSNDSINYYVENGMGSVIDNYRVQKEDGKFYYLSRSGGQDYKYQTKEQTYNSYLPHNSEKFGVLFDFDNYVKEGEDYFVNYQGTKFKAKVGQDYDFGSIVYTPMTTDYVSQRIESIDILEYKPYTLQDAVEGQIFDFVDVKNAVNQNNYYAQVDLDDVEQVTIRVKDSVISNDYKNTFYYEIDGEHYVVSQMNSVFWLSKTTESNGLNLGRQTTREVISQVAEDLLTYDVTETFYGFYYTNSNQELVRFNYCRVECYDDIVLYYGERRLKFDELGEIVFELPDPVAFVVNADDVRNAINSKNYAITSAGTTYYVDGDNFMVNGEVFVKDNGGYKKYTRGLDHNSFVTYSVTDWSEEIELLDNVYALATGSNYSGPWFYANQEKSEMIIDGVKVSCDFDGVYTVTFNDSTSCTISQFGEVNVSEPSTDTMDLYRETLIENKNYTLSISTYMTNGPFSNDIAGTDVFYSADNGNKIKEVMTEYDILNDGTGTIITTTYAFKEGNNYYIKQTSGQDFVNGQIPEKAFKELGAFGDDKGLVTFLSSSDYTYENGVYTHNDTIEHKDQTLKDITVEIEDGELTLVAYYDIEFGTGNITVCVTYVFSNVNGTNVEISA